MLWTKYKEAFHQLHEETNDYLLKVGRNQEIIPKTKLNDMLAGLEAATTKAIPSRLKVLTSFQKQCWTGLHTIDDKWKDFRRYTTEVREQVSLHRHINCFTANCMLLYTYMATAKHTNNNV